MKKNNSYILLFFVAMAVLLSACKKNSYLIGAGSLNQAKVNMTTYDYLKNEPHHLFDTLVILIDKAGLQDTINQPGITFFAPTDYSIDNYLYEKTLQAQNVDPNTQYSIDTLIKYDLNTFKDSILAYIVRPALNFPDLTPKGTMFTTDKSATYSVVSYEPTYDQNLGYYSAVSTPPSIVYYTLLTHPITGPFDAENFTSTDGAHTRVQTFGILTTTGTIGVLGNEHVLYFGY